MAVVEQPGMNGDLPNFTIAPKGDDPYDSGNLQEEVNSSRCLSVAVVIQFWDCVRGQLLLNLAVLIKNKTENLAAGRKSAVFLLL